MSPRISDEELNQWANRRADDAGRLARELRDARSELTAARSENEALRKALDDSRKTIRNAWGAVTSGQATDKQVDKTLEHGFRAIEEALAARLLLPKDADHG